MQRQEQELETAGTGPSTGVETVERAYAWLARFSPLLDDPQDLTSTECRRRVAAVPALRRDGEAVLADLRTDTTDEQVAQTVEQALAELDGLETGLERRAPTGRTARPAVDLGAFQGRLAEARARQEVEELAPSLATEPFKEIVVSRGNLGAGLMLGLFSLGWLSFTTFHASLMLRHAFRAFGPLALFLLLFYGIFFAVGGAMAWGAYRAACEERITIAGKILTVHRRLFGLLWKRTHQLGDGCRARIRLSSVRQQGNTVTEIVLPDETGKEVRVGSGITPPEQAELVRQLNEYLAMVCG